FPPTARPRSDRPCPRPGPGEGSSPQSPRALSGRLPTPGVPPRAPRREQETARLGQVAATVSQFAGAVPGSATAATPQLSPIDKALGGQALVGLKTPLAIVAYAGLWIMQTFGAVGPGTGDKATATGSVLTALISAFGALGVTAKFDRAFQGISSISALLQKLPHPPASAPTAKTGGS